MNKTRVLIVEDEPITAMDEHEILSRLGYEVIGMTFSGNMALEQIKNDQPDVVLMDVMLLGELNGLQAAEKIRQDYGLPVIFVTALGNNLKSEPMVADEGIEIVSKPYTEEKLAAALKKVLP